MRDTSSAPWHLVRSTHKQILLMVEHKQLKWEDASTRDAISAVQLLLAKEEAIQAKFLDLPAKSTKPGNKPQSKEEPIKPCHSFPDASLVEMLEFGFPIGYTAPHTPAPHTGNHPSANQFPADIDAYLNKGAPSFCHHRASRPPPITVAMHQSHDDQA